MISAMYILVVFQLNAGNYMNWDIVGEFKTRAACTKAATQLVSQQEQVQSQYSKPKAFACLAKDTD